MKRGEHILNGVMGTTGPLLMTALIVVQNMH